MLPRLGLAKATTITRLAGPDDKAASPLSLDLVSKIVTVLDCGIEDRLEVVNELQINAGQICMTPTQQSQ